MEQRELGGPSRLKGDDVDFFPSGSATGPEAPGKGLPAIRERLEEEEDDLGLGRDVDANSSPDSEKWVPGDALEEHEFSIKEASFSEGSLKLKIQTTKRAKKPPKSLENYICPPEIRVTIKQLGEQKVAKQAKNSKGGKDEDKTLHKKKVSTIEKPFGQNEGDLGDFLGDSVKPKHLLKSSFKHQLDWTTPPAGGSSSDGILPDSDSKIEQGVNRLPHPDLASSIPKPQLKKVTESASPTQFVSALSSQITSSVMQSPSGTHTSLTPQPENSITMLSSLSKERGFQEVADQVFGNVKRKYGRKESTRCSVSHNSDIQWGRKAENDSEPKSQAMPKDKQIHENIVDPPNREMESIGKIATESEVRSEQTDESKMPPGKKRQSRRSPKDQLWLDDMTEEPRTSENLVNTCRDFSEPKVSNKAESRSAKLVEGSLLDVAGLISGAQSELVETCQNRLRKNGLCRSKAAMDSKKSEDMKPTKAMERVSCQKFKGSILQKDNNPIPSVPEPPSAYPITPSSPLYANTDSLTVITPVKKKRGRPKKQPLLTVETIHEGTSTSPVSPITRESPSILKQRRKKQNLPNLMSVTTMSAPLGKRISYAGTFDKKSVQNKTKQVKMQNILNKILSCPTSSSLALKSKSPVSNVVSTMASTIEASLGKQINVSKRGTIYIGKKRGRKPRAVTKVPEDEHKASDKHPVPVSSQFENLVVPSSLPTTAGMPSPRAMQTLSAHVAGAGGILSTQSSDASMQDLKTMPNLQPISALPTKAHKALLGSSSWKLSPPRLMANSPSHLSEVASLKEVTLSPVSESHSEETIPSDSGIGTDNNSTSDQAEKGPACRRRYSFDLCSFETSEAAALEATSKAMRAHCPKHVATVTVENFLAQENLKKQKHRRKRKNLQRRDDLQFLADLEELIGKFQVIRISHRSYNLYPENLYPSIFRINFDHYYPMPYFPYDPLHYLRRNSEIKSKRRRGRPAKAAEPMTKMPFIQGFGFPIPSSNYYAPYTMPYSSMPVATNMMNIGYYSQYQSPFFLSHTVGAATSPFIRPAVPPPPQFHSGAHVKLTTSAKYKTKHATQQMGSTRIDDSQTTLVALKGGKSNLSNVRLHKHKHKHKHKYKEDHLSGSQREGLDGLFSESKNPGFLNFLNERLDISNKETSLSKLKDKQRNLQSTQSLPRSFRNIFEADKLSALSLSDSQQSKRSHEREQADDFPTSYAYQHGESMQSRQRLSSDFFGAGTALEEENDLRGKRRNLDNFEMFREQNMVPFKNVGMNKMQKMFHCPSLLSTEYGSPLKQRLKRKEVEEVQSEVRNMCAFSKILSTKKNLDHVNKILKVKRLQRQAKTGNNFVKKRRGRPRKQPILLDSELTGQMPILEKCVDLPGKKSVRTGMLSESMEFSNHDSILDTIESVVHMAQLPPQPVRGAKRWQKMQEEVQVKRSRRCRVSKEEETGPTERSTGSSGLLQAIY
ncbi:SET-binding protein [Arapaima gigas]